MKRRDFDHANNVRKIRLMTSLDTLNQTLMKSRFLMGKIALASPYYYSLGC